MWLKILGARYAIGEPRVRPEGVEDWHPVAEELFTEETNGILHADGAPVYTNTATITPGIVEVHQVDHGNKVFARSVIVIADTSKAIGEPGHTRPGMAGTMSIDSEWRRVKKEFPETKLAGSTAAGQRRAATYLRCGQWKRMTAREDRWAAFCTAAKDYRQENVTRAGLVRPRVQKAAIHLPVQAPDPAEAHGDACEMILEPAALCNPPDVSSADAQQCFQMFGSGSVADAASVLADLDEDQVEHMGFLVCDSLLGRLSKGTIIANAGDKYETISHHVFIIFSVPFLLIQHMSMDFRALL